MTIGQKYGIEYNTIINLYWLEVPKWSTHDIAKYYGCSPSIIHGFMKKYGIPTRNHREAGIVVWECLPKREKLTKAFNTEEVKRRRAEILAERNKNRDYSKSWTMERRAKASKRMKERMNDPEFREKALRAMLEGNIKAWGDPNYRERRSQMTKEQWKDPLIKEKMRIGISRAKTKYNK